MPIQQRPFLQTKSNAVARVIHTGGSLSSTNDATLEEERREIVASVMGALAGAGADPDEMAACSHLLKHLSQTGRPAEPPAA